MGEEPRGAARARRPRTFRSRDPRTVRHWLGVAGAVVLVVGVLPLVMKTAGSANSDRTVAKDYELTSRRPSPSRRVLTDPAEPSGQAPMSANALPGFTQTYVNDFTGTSLPTGWDAFGGTASGDPGSQFGSAHVTVANGLLSLNTWLDPSYGNEWVTGGLCQCGQPMTYGAYFVRSRVTGPGPTIVELLWPTAGWPPEIDFTETGGSTTSTTATVVWAENGGQNQVQLNVDMTQWHTWGVVWTPTMIFYTLDGNVWGTFDVASDIPHQPMTLNLQQQTWCSSNFACPTLPQSAQIDWVAEYSPVVNYSTTIGPFSAKSWTLSASLKSAIAQLALSIATQGAQSVQLTGYSDSKTMASVAEAVGGRRASVVKAYLLTALSSIGDDAVTASSAVP